MQDGLGEAVLSSIKDYLSILKPDLRRDVSLVKKLLFESLTGPKVRDNNLLSSLAAAIGGRKKSIIESSARRVKLELSTKMLPIVSRLIRKAPEGEKYISNQWKAEAYGFYESHLISDVIKGVNNVFKVLLSWIINKFKQTKNFFCKGKDKV